MIHKTFDDLKSVSGNDKQKSSVQISCCLYLLTAFNQLEWRVPLLWQNVFNSYLNNMSHPYKTIRETVTSFLYFATANDVDYSIIFNNTVNFNLQHQTKNMSSLNKLVSHIQSKLEKSVELFEVIGDVSEKNKAVQMSNLNEFISSLNFLQSTLDWLFSYESKALQPYNTELARLIVLVTKKNKRIDFFLLQTLFSFYVKFSFSCATRTK